MVEYRLLGGTGLHVSEVGLGTNTFGRYCDCDQAIRIMKQAFELGVNYFDTADMYGNKLSETFVGKGLAGRRHEVVLASKVGRQLGSGPNDRGLSYGRVVARCEASLRALGTDYIDLYYLHCRDPYTPLSETLAAFDDLVHQGKVRYVGISNYSAWQVCEALWIADRRNFRPPVVIQNCYNLLDRGIENELLPFCRAHNVGIVPYFPLAAGMLTGKYRANEAAPVGTRLADSVPIYLRWRTERNFELVAALEGFARARNHTTGELAIAWLLAHPEVSTVIPGATKPEQVSANVAAARWRLTREEMAEIDVLAPALLVDQWD